MSTATLRIKELGLTSNIQWKNVGILIGVITVIVIIVIVVKKKNR